MSRSIQIKNHKAFIINDDDKDNLSEKETITLLPFLNCSIELDDDTLFDDIWNLIVQDYEVYSVIFSEKLGGFPLELFIDQYRKPINDESEDENPENKVETLEAYWLIKIETFKNKTYFHASSELHGYGPQSYTDHAGNVIKKNGGWSLSFLPINEYKRFKLRLKNTANIRNKNLDNNNFSNYEALVSWTVYDLLSAILEEISFHGSPNDQLRQIHELDQSLSEIRDGAAEFFEIDLNDLNKEESE